jgi:hypothetical protein
MPGGPVLNPTARGRRPWAPEGEATAGTTGRSANPMPFPRIPSGDIISVVSRRLGRAKRFVNDLLSRQFLNLEDCRCDGANLLRGSVGLVRPHGRWRRWDNNRRFRVSVFFLLTDPHLSWKLRTWPPFAVGCARWVSSSDKTQRSNIVPPRGSRKIYCRWLPIWSRGA